MSCASRSVKHDRGGFLTSEYTLIKNFFDANVSFLHFADYTLPAQGSEESPLPGIPDVVLLLLDRSSACFRDKQ